MLVAAVAPHTKVAPIFVPCPFRGRSSRSKKDVCLPLSASLRLSVCSGLCQLQSDHHCNINKEKSNGQELYQI